MSETNLPAEATGPQVTSPRALAEIPGLWLQVLHMTEGFFAQEASRASGTNTLIGIVFYGVTSAIVMALVALVTGGMEMAGVASEARSTFVTANGHILVIPSLLFAIVGVPLLYYLTNGMIYLGARVLSGTGTFVPQAYLMSLFYVPLGIVMAVVALIPYAGFLIVIALGIYIFILEVRTIKVVHQLNTGQAVAAIVLPGLLLFLFICVAGILIVGVFSKGWS